MCADRFWGIRCGTLLVIIGLLWLAQRLGWFPPGMFGPLLFVVIGAWIILAHHLKGRGNDGICGPFRRQKNEE